MTLVLCAALALSGCHAILGIDDLAGPPPDGQSSTTMPPPADAPPVPPADANIPDCDLVSALLNDDMLPMSELMTQLNSLAVDRDPVLTDDELTIYLHSERPNGLGNGDIWVATRPGRKEPFIAPVLAGSFSTSDNDSRISFTSDRLTAFLASRRMNLMHGGSNIWSFRRNEVGDLFPMPVAEDEVNTNSDEYDPHISSDGQRLYFSTFLAQGLGGQDLVVARRNPKTNRFNPPQLLEGVNSAGIDADPTLSADERLLIFTRDNRLMFATRPDRDAAFSEPRLIMSLNNGSVHGDAFITADSCELFYAGINPNGGAFDIYRVSLQP